LTRPRTGELFWATLEDGGRRPVLVVSREALNRGNRVVVLPVTSQRFAGRKDLRTAVVFQAGEAGLDRDCVAAAEGIMNVPREALDADPISVLSGERLRDLVRAVGAVMGATCEPD
jgi:mRNA-degrading endonuclease toxin of MazEF toxin-antitoxin module